DPEGPLVRDPARIGRGGAVRRGGEARAGGEQNDEQPLQTTLLHTSSAGGTRPPALRMRLTYSLSSGESTSGISSASVASCGFAWSFSVGSPPKASPRLARSMAGPPP